MGQCDLKTLRTEEIIIINLLCRRSDKRIIMVPFGLICYGSMKVKMDKNFRRGLKTVTKVKLPSSLRQTAIFMWNKKGASQKHSSFPPHSVYTWPHFALSTK